MRIGLVAWRQRWTLCDLLEKLIRCHKVNLSISLIYSYFNGRTKKSERETKWISIGQFLTKIENFYRKNGKKKEKIENKSEDNLCKFHYKCMMPSIWNDIWTQSKIANRWTKHTENPNDIGTDDGKGEQINRIHLKIIGLVWIVLELCLKLNRSFILDKYKFSLELFDSIHISPSHMAYIIGCIIYQICVCIIGQMSIW